MLLPHARLTRNKRRYRHHYVDDDVIRLRYLGKVKNQPPDLTAGEFNRMAASKPTSWLSKPSHLVSHLTMALGP